MWRCIKNERGLSLIELLVATVIIIMALVGFSIFLAKGFGVINSLGSDRLALEFAEGRLERLIAEGAPAAVGWQTVTLDNHGTAATADDLVGEYQWTVVADPNTAPDGKLITLTLYYPKDPAEARLDGQKEVRLARIYVP